MRTSSDQTERPSDANGRTLYVRSTFTLQPGQEKVLEDLILKVAKRSSRLTNRSALVRAGIRALTKMRDHEIARLLDE